MIYWGVIFCMERFWGEVGEGLIFFYFVGRRMFVSFGELEVS